MEPVDAVKLVYQSAFGCGHLLSENCACRVAEELARTPARGDVPVGCVIVKDGEIIGEGRNRREEHGDATAHAELEAIRDACARLGSWRLHGCTLYVTLEPCPMLSLIHISEPTRQAEISYAVFCLKKKKNE